MSKTASSIGARSYRGYSKKGLIMAKQVNVQLPEEDVKEIEGMALSLSKDSKKRITVSDIVREAVKEYISRLKFAKGTTLNKFFEIISNNTTQDVQVVVNVGDRSFNAELGRCEVLVSTDASDHIDKIECSCLLKIPGWEDARIAHPSLVSIELPSDLIVRDTNFEYRMYLTAMRSLDSIGDFETCFNQPDDTPAWQSITDLGQYVEEKRAKWAARSELLVNCEPHYESLRLPVAKLKAKQIKHFPNTASYGRDGYLIKFEGKPQE